MIYIDPPYNTGNDNFIYPDKFSETKSEYLKKIKEKDEKGYLLKEGLFHKNSKENGQFHSNWLNMMYPRLFLAKNLLKDDGVIFISIDDNEVHNLRLLMNEIFGEENFIANLIWESKYTVSNDAKYISYQHENILFFCKNKEEFSIGKLDRTDEQNQSYKNRDNDIKGAWKATPLHAKSGTENSKYSIVFDNGIEWKCPSGRYPRYSKDTLINLYKNGELYFNSNGGVDKKTYLSKVESKGVVSGSILRYQAVGHTHGNNEEIASLLGKGIFDNPKGVSLLLRLLKLGNASNQDIILDFFAGSGTTAQAVMELNKQDGGNRKFICVQLPEKTEEKSEAFKAGYKTIAEISKERIRRAAKKIEAEAKREYPILSSLSSERQGKECPDLGFKVYKLKESSFKIWRSDMVSDEEELKAGIDLFENPLKDGAKEENVLLELLLKCGYDLNVKAEIIEADNSKIYAVNDNELIVCLEKVSDKIISKILELKPAKCLMLDSLFDGRDSFKTNTVLQLQDAEIDLVVI